jgi:hypothetical protein
MRSSSASVNGPARRVEIESLSPGHAGRAGHFAKYRAGVAGVAQTGGAEHDERQRLQRVAGQQRCRLAECHVTRWPASPQRVVIHARQVVVDERIGVDQFDGGSRRVSGVGGGSDGFRGRVDQQRSDPLSPAERRVAHRFSEFRGGLRDRRQRTVERRFDAALVGRCPDGEFDVRLHRRRRA